MAEAAVEVLKLTLDLILNSPGFDFEGVRQQVSKIKLELDSMQSFLRDAERYKDGNEGLCCWVSQVRDASLQAEDVLDEFLYHLYSVKRDRFLGCLRRAAVFPREMWKRYQTVAQLKEFKHEIKDISKRSKRYDLSNHDRIPDFNHSLNYAQHIGETSFFVEATALVGLEEENSQLLNWLIGGEKERSVVSIVGMGGSGKTTLAARAYNSRTVKACFDCFVWVSVSQNYMIEDLLKAIINEFSSRKFTSLSLSETNYIQLVETIVNLLQGKRYLIVFDDVWSNILWKQVSVALPDHKNGSRVIITTRKEDIASYPYGAGSHVLHCKPLAGDAAMTLFCNKAFCNEACPPELEDVAWQLVAKCGGLPLAILALSGLMASMDRTELKWREVYDSLNWHISENPLLDEVKTILLLSFKELPYFLKNCFLYCCCFPTDHWVGAGRLIRTWMAEGFLEERKGLSPEEVGKNYLRELIHRNLLEVKKHDSLLRPKLCKLHDLMWEIARFVSDKDHFLSVCSPQDLEGDIKARRISLHAIESMPHPGQDMRYLRSFYAFFKDQEDTFPLDDLLQKFRLLRVLELIGAPVDNLPKTLGKLFNLRYLGLKRTKISELPPSISRLRNLQTLDIRQTRIKELPKEIGKLRNLRHLLIYAGSDEEVFYYIKGTKGPDSIVKLRHLQVVNCLVANPHLVKRLGKLTQLRRLGLTNLSEDDGIPLCASIEKMKGLHHLLLVAKDENEYLKVDRLTSTPLVLRKLTLAGRLTDVPHWFSSLRNVMHLHLHWSQLPKDPIPCLSKLPVLERLTLINACSPDSNQLFFTMGFPRLEDLHLSHFPELTEIEFHDGAMPNLARMTINNCKKVKRVPKGIENLRSLQRLQLKHVSEELISSIYSEDCIDVSPKLKLIPSKVYDRTSSTLYGA